MMLIGFDIDGTVADRTHRRRFVTTKPKNWKAFNEAMLDDQPIMPIIKLAGTLHSVGHQVFFQSGREGSAKHRTNTEAWLAAHVGVWTRDVPLFMRRAKDFRADYIVKEEILDELIIPHFGRQPDLIFDDRNSVVEMWRRRGIQCCQVAPGDF